MTHWCALHGALLGDQHQILDPALPQDSLVLGIQGTLAVHELHTIRERLGNSAAGKGVPWRIAKRRAARIRGGGPPTPTQTSRPPRATGCQSSVQEIQNVR